MDEPQRGNVPDGWYSRGESTDYSGTEILTLVWTLSSVGCIVQTLRAFSQLKIKGRLELDDQLIFISWLLSVIGAGLLTKSVTIGQGKTGPFSDQEATEIMKFGFWTTIANFTSITIGRISCAIFLLNFAGTERRWRYLLWAIVVSQVFFGLSTVVVLLARCRPLRKVWSPTVPGWCLPWEVQQVFVFVTGGVNSLTDLSLSLISAAIVSKLRMDRRLKMSIYVMLCLSILAMIASIIETAKVENVKTPNDMRKNTVALWAFVEHYVVIITASAPKIWPLIVAWCKGPTSKTPVSQPRAPRTPHTPRTPRTRRGRRRHSSSDQSSIQLTSLTPSPAEDEPPEQKFDQEKQREYGHHDAIQIFI